MLRSIWNVRAQMQNLAVAKFCSYSSSDLRQSGSGLRSKMESSMRLKFKAHRFIAVIWVSQMRFFKFVLMPLTPEKSQIAIGEKTKARVRRLSC